MGNRRNVVWLGLVALMALGGCASGTPRVSPVPTRTAVPKATAAPTSFVFATVTAAAEAVRATQTAATLPTKPPAQRAATVAISKPTAQTSGKFVASKDARSKFYYCFSDDGWRSLKPENLIWSDDENRFIKMGLKLHAPCQ